MALSLVEFERLAFKLLDSGMTWTEDLAQLHSGRVMVRKYAGHVFLRTRERVPDEEAR